MIKLQWIVRRTLRILPLKLAQSAVLKYFVLTRLAAQQADQLSARPINLPLLLADMRRQADGATFIVYGARHRLPNPQDCVGGQPVSAVQIKPPNGREQ